MAHAFINVYPSNHVSRKYPSNWKPWRPNWESRCRHCCFNEAPSSARTYPLLTQSQSGTSDPAVEESELTQVREGSERDVIRPRGAMFSWLTTV
ncbi:hypothetical protein ACFX13_011558 [Malus domestica]